MEELMWQAVRNRLNPGYREENEAILRCLEYWRQNDFMEHGSMAHIFEHLYMKTEHFGDTQIKLSLDLGVSDRTLLRYRKKFVRLFSYNLELIRQGGEYRRHVV